MVMNQQGQIETYFLQQAKVNISSSSPPPLPPTPLTPPSSSLKNIEITASDGCDEESLPTELNTINSSGGFSVVSTDKLSVRYTNINLHGHDVGVVQSNHPAPVKRVTYYFEMKVKNCGAKGRVSIGFTTESFKMRRQPGFVFLFL